MDNYKLKQKVSETVREEIRKGRLVKSNDVLSILPELIDSIYIDKNQLKEGAENCLGSNNPFNAVLKLFGLQVIKKEKMLEGLINPEDEYADASIEINDDEANLYLKKWLVCNSEQLENAVEKIADKLYEIESQASSEFNEKKNRANDLYDQLEKKTNDYDQLKRNFDTQEKNIAEGIQYMLVQDSESDTNKQLVDLLRDVMEIEVHWDSENSELSDATMFTIYKTDEVAKTSKPCLVRNGKVFIKGVRFVTEN